jgi:hypothetical protein
MSTVPNGYALAIQAAILVLAVLSLTFSWWATREGSPVIAIFGRWIRWLFLGSLIAGTTAVFGWSGYPFPVLLAVSLMAIFLIETAYNWLAISALSKSELPLFPKFRENDRGDEWPSSPGFIELKGWLRNSGFQKRQALVSLVGDSILMRISVYENDDQTIRVHVLLLPNARGNTAVCFTFFSQTQQGDAIVTDNIFLPFGGFYPENWQVERRPWMRSAEKLLDRHKARIDAMGQPLMPFVLTPLEQINEDQRTVEQLNRDLGFLHSPPEDMEFGRLTVAGKARIWQEIWTLAYLGLPLRYS